MKRKMFLLTVLLVFCIVFMIGCKSAKKPNNTPETTGNDTTSSVQSPEQTTGAPETASPAVTTAKPAVTTAKPAVTTAPVVEKLPLGVKVTSISELEKLDASAHKINVLKAFLEGDFEKLIELYSYLDSDFAQMPLLKISSFEAWSEKEKGSTDNSVFVTINVSESQLDTLPVGTHTMTFNELREYFVKVGGVEGTKNEPKTETEIFMSCWLKSKSYLWDKEYEAKDAHAYLDFIHKYYLTVRGEGGTRDEYIKYFKLLTSNEPGDQLERYYSFEKGGKADYSPSHGHGATRVWFDFVESGEDYVTMQYYLDHGYLIKGPVIKYNFTRIDGMLVPSTYEYIDSRFKEMDPASYTT